MGANVAFVFAGVGREIGGVAAQLTALSTLDFAAFSAIGDAMKADAEEARKRLEAFEQRVLNPQASPTAAPGTKPAPVVPTGSSKTPKKKIDAPQDALADAAKAYADAMDLVNRAQVTASTSGLNLTATQQKLLEVMVDPAFALMPEQWRVMIAEQAEYALQAEKIAADQQRLNELVAATPTAQLEAQRGTMQFLADAFNEGRISADQFSEAASTALGNVPDKAKPAADSFVDLAKIAQDGAKDMAGAFVDYLFDPIDQSIGDMVTSFAKGIAKMIAQQQILKAMQASSIFGGLFADGGAFGQSGQINAFASGGVVDRPQFFKFASGGSFKAGVMGEAGPEAILPLKRGSDGKLGVTMNGGADSGVTVNITVNESGQSTTDGNGGAEAQQLGESLKAAVLHVLIREKRAGGLLAGA
ncbi:phage tail tape measure protein [Azoarcus sp. L1K30]|uniref:phage tail tape measure protein n=1 Tax=Azoarcus sp. L1K30 TaxID=2820277 RepID=UPI001B822C06|nr:phage tail tape measure protein [Azoarcus sp. L1K30]MBR0568006.1 phage tail tape measure protein [Azoarcus sp. L1K30]